ncbi:MFS transporter [Halorientalis marina]|uniref:MFS transporter n=1 Tax=Halorientalis marina TaxID=2931976 RepID=UPI0035661897
MLVSLAVAWATLQFGRFLLSPLLPAIIDDLGITKVAAGVALGAFQGIYALTQFPSGRLSDRFTRASLIVPGLGTLAVGFLVLSVTVSYPLFLLAAVVVGVGKGLFAVPSRALLSDLFVARRGRALGLYSAGTDVGGILASAVGVLVTGGAAAWLPQAVTTGALDWRAPFAPVAVLLALIGVVYVVWNRDAYELGRTEIGLVATVRRLATTRAQREALVAFALFYFVIGAWVNFLPTYLTESKGFSESLAAGLFAVVFLVGIWAKPLAGAVSDRVPRRPVAVVTLLFAGGALVVVEAVGGLLPVVAAIAVFAVGYKAQFPIADAILLDAAPDENVGGDLGAARALFLGVGALGPVYLGVVATAVSYRVAFAGLVACLLASAGLLARGALRG